MPEKQPPAQYVKPPHKHEWQIEAQPVYSSQIDGTVTVQEIRVKTCKCGQIKVLSPSEKRVVSEASA